MKFKLLVILFLTIGAYVSAQSRLVFIPAEYSNFQIDSLKGKLNSSDDNTKIEIYTILTYALKKTNLQEAINFGNSGLLLARSVNNRKGEADILTELGKCYHFAKDYNTELKYHKDALEIRKSIDDKIGMGISLDFIGQTYFDSMNYIEALKYYLESYDIFDRLNDKERIAITANDIGIVNNYLGNYEIALDYYFKALKIKEEIAPLTSKSATFANIGDVYMNIKDYDNAKTYFQKSADHSEFSLASSLIKIKLGTVYQYTNEIPKATELLFNSLAMLEKVDNYVYRGLAYMSLGKLFYNINKLDSSLIFFNKAFDTYTHYGSKVGKIEATNCIVPILIKNKNVSLALSLLNEILPVADSLNLKEKLLTTYENLSIAYELVGNYKASLEFRKKSNAARDSIFSVEKTRRIVSMQLIYQSEKKAQEIEQLVKENSYEVKLRNTIVIIAVLLLALIGLVLRQYFLKKRENNELEVKNRMITSQKELLEETTNELRETIATKDKFFSIISHDLKNPFHSILSVSDLLANSIDKLSKDTIVTFADELNKTASNAYRLLQNLLDWARLQRGKMVFEPRLLNISELISEIIISLSKNAEMKEIKIKNNVPEELFVTCDENMTRLIISNLLSNAIKYSRIGETVTIAFNKEHDLYNFSIIDEGVGIPPEILDKLFKVDSNISTSGTAKEKGTGLGLILCKDMAERHNGKIIAQSTLDKGSIFTFSLPVI